jgi:hypothetical protein
MTTTSPSTPRPRPATLRICSFLVGAAGLAATLIAALRIAAGPDVSIGAVAGVAFLSMFVGGILGLVWAQRILASEAPRTVAVTVIYALTALALPALAYIIPVMLFLLWFQSYQF